MKQNISQLDSVTMKNNATELMNSFQRIAEAEKDQWLPYYYAAYLSALQGIMTTDNSKKDAIADKAESLLAKAEEVLGKENSEMYVVESLIATTRMTADPQSRYMTFGPQIAAALGKAKELDPTNPRPFLIEAQNLFYTPEAFGGGKKAAQPLFEKAKALFENFKPESDLSPTWGRAALNYFLQNYQQ